MDLIQVSASCVAEIAQASPSARLRKLVPFKYNNRGEGAGRSAYYKLTVDTVRKFHRGDNERKHIRSAAEHLLGIQDNASLSRNIRTRARLNIEALLAYENLYGNRKFNVLHNHRLSIAVGPVTVTAQPDLWVIENGHIVRIKIGVGKEKTPHYVDLVLYLLWQAALKASYNISLENVVYLNVRTGKEMICTVPLSQLDATVKNSCREIVRLWDSVPPPVGGTMKPAKIT